LLFSNIQNHNELYLNEEIKLQELCTLQRPIVHLSDKFKELATGDLTIEPIAIHTNDEIGELGHNFNQMLEQLHKLIQSLHEHIGIVTTTSNKLMSSARNCYERRYRLKRISGNHMLPIRRQIRKENLS